MSEYLGVKKHLESMGLSYSEGAPLNLENFDEETKEKIILNSPRSIEACLRTGISATELLKRSQESFEEKGLSKDVVVLRYNHFETRRKEKIELLREERQKVLMEDLNITFENLDPELAPPQQFTTLLDEQYKVEYQLNKNRKYLEQFIEHELEARRKMAENERKVKEKDDRIEMEKQKRLDMQQAIITKREEDYVERQHELDRLHQKQQEEEMERQKAVDEKDEKRQKQVEERIKDLKARTDLLKMKNEDRSKQTLIHNEQITKMKEAHLKEKQEHFEKKLHEIEEMKQQSQEEAANVYLMKAQKYSETLYKAEAIANDKKARAEDKIVDEEDQMKKFEQNKALLMQKKKIEDFNREMHRVEVIEKAREELEKKVEKTIQKTQHTEQLSEELLEKTRQQSLKKAEEQRLKEIEKMESVERTKRIEEFKKIQKLAIIEEKNRRSEMLELGKKELAERMQHQKVLLERSKHLLSKINPESPISAGEITDAILETSEMSLEELEKVLSPRRGSLSASTSSRRGSIGSISSKK